MVLVGINIVASILGTLGNLFVCITVCTTRGMVSSFHYFIVSLAAADLMVALLDQPLLVSMIFAHVKFKCIPVVDKMFRAIGNFACAVSLLTLALIALDRCLFVLPSINYKNTMTTGKKIVLAVVWTLAGGYAALRLTVNKTVTSYLTAAVFGVCYVEMILCYTVVYYQVFKQREFLKESLCAQRQQSKSNHWKTKPRKILQSGVLLARSLWFCWFSREDGFSFSIFG